MVLTGQWVRPPAPAVDADVARLLEMASPEGAPAWSAQRVKIRIVPASKPAG
jgi:hypothetical protein